MSLPLASYDHVLALKDTLEGEVRNDFVSYINKKKFHKVNYLLSVGGATEQMLVANIAQRIYSWEVKLPQHGLGCARKITGCLLSNRLLVQKFLK